jgi:hypothetical protein
MPQIIKILNGGFSNINGQPVGVIIFRISKNESKPEDHLAYCPAKQKVEVIKSLQKLHWIKEKQSIKNPLSREQKNNANLS